MPCACITPSVPALPGGGRSPLKFSCPPAGLVLVLERAREVCLRRITTEIQTSLKKDHSSPRTAPSPLNPPCWCLFPQEAEPFPSQVCRFWEALQENVLVVSNQSSITLTFPTATTAWGGTSGSRWCSPTLPNLRFYLFIPHFQEIYCEANTDGNLHPRGHHSDGNPLNHLYLPKMCVCVFF